MNCNKCKKKSCGCSDQALTTGLSCTCDTPSCPNGDPCAETFDSKCIVYTGDEIVDLGINRGDRVEIIIQKLVLALTNPSCIFPGNSCGSVTGVSTTAITNSTISLKWLASATGVTYSVEYRLATSGTWLLNPSTPNLIDTITGLIPASDYLIRVNTICTLGTCYSLTIKVKTKTI